MGSSPSVKRWSPSLPICPTSCATSISLGEAAKPIYEADRHAKKELKKRIRGIRAIERSLEEESGEEAQTVHEYCLAVRSSLTDDGHPPLSASGLKLHDRLTQISASIDRVAEKRGFPSSLNACNAF